VENVGRVGDEAERWRTLRSVAWVQKSGEVVAHQSSSARRPRGCLLAEWMWPRAVPSHSQARVALRAGGAVVVPGGAQVASDHKGT
jgi:hypothetical protein